MRLNNKIINANFKVEYFEVGTNYVSNTNIKVGSTWKFRTWELDRNILKSQACPISSDITNYQVNLCELNFKYY